MKFWKATIFIVIIVLLVFGIYSLKKERKIYDVERDNLQKKFDGLKLEQENLNENINYFGNQENLLKEARTQFNLKKPDENLVIIVPSLNNPSSTAASSATSSNSKR